MAKKLLEKATTNKAKGLWQDDYWLMLMQLYLRKPTGLKPTYCREMVDLSLELHIAPLELAAKMEAIARLDTPRIERIWKEYANNPQRLKRAVRLLREMKGFNSGGDFFEGVAVEETFERNFRPLAEDERLTPIMLVLVLDLYFRLTPITMVAATPEVQELARLMKIPVKLVVDILDIFQHCDPYLNRKDMIVSPLLLPCTEVWKQYGNGDTILLAAYAEELKAYFR